MAGSRKRHPAASKALRAAVEAASYWAIAPEQPIELPPAHPDLAERRAKVEKPGRRPPRES
jgi:hypothetical protein